jgi:hypothetical protein
VVTRTEIARRRHRLRKIREVVARRRFDATVYSIRPAAEMEPTTSAGDGQATP